MPKLKKEFYSVCTYFLEEFESVKTNEIYFENKQDAINNITNLFNRCYPSGEQSLIADNGSMIESPKYNDHDCYLMRFTTTALYCYELSTNEFE